MRNIACINFDMFTCESEKRTWQANCNFNRRFETERLLHITGSHIHYPVILLPSCALSTCSKALKYKLLSLIYKIFTTTQPQCLDNLNSVQCLAVLALHLLFNARPPTSSSLKITDRCFRFASPCLWNQLPMSLRQPHSGTSLSIADSPIPSPITSSSFVSSLCSSITPSLVIPGLKRFHKSPRSFTSVLRTAYMDYHQDRFF